MISELVALSVKEGSADPIDLRLELGDTHVKGIVLDTVAQAFLQNANEGSLALRIIDGLVDEWRADPGRGGVWFRMSVTRLDAA